MPDDTDTPAPEPRTAVEAAGDPAHGGGQAAFGNAAQQQNHQALSSYANMSGLNQQGQAALASYAQSGQTSSFAQQVVDPPPAPYIPTPDDVVTFAGQVAGGANGAVAAVENVVVGAESSMPQSNILGIADYHLLDAPMGTAGTVGVTGISGHGGPIGSTDDKPRTILSGVERLDALKMRAADVLHEALTLVRAMQGTLDGDNSPQDWKWTVSADTAGKIHDAVFDMEGLFKTLSTAIAQARASHG